MRYGWLFAAGVIHVPIYAIFPPAWLLSSAALVLILLRRPWSLLAAAFLLGTALGSWNLQRWCDRQLEPRFEQQIFELHFQIVSIPRQSENSTVFLAQVLDLQCPTAPCPDLRRGRLRLSWYKNRQTLAAGQVYRAEVKLRRPRGLVNPGGFDYHAWLLAQEVVATGYIVRQASLTGESDNWAARRAGLDRSLLQELYPSPYRRFWTALLVGEQSGITQEDWATLQATGTVHLLVISGLHISLVALWCFGCGAAAARLLGLSHRGSNSLVMHFLPPLCAAAGAVYYTALAGFSVPTLRALVACLALMCGRLCGLRLTPFTLLGFGALVVGLSEPFAWENAGFWLSFLAVAVLFYSLGSRGKQPPLRAFVHAQLVLTVGLLLPLLVLGQGVSLTSPVANLIAVPVVSLVITPLLLLAALLHTVAPPFAQLMLQVSDWIFGGLWWFLQFLQALPLPLWWPAQPQSVWLLAIAGIGVLLLLAPAGLYLRGFGAVWLCAALCLRDEPDYRLRVTVLDVGQGTAVLLQTPAAAWLYDAGPRFSDEFDAGSRIVAPYLRQLGLRPLNMVISHADTDHAGGALGVSQAVPLERVLAGEPVPGLKSAAPCLAGQSWREEEVEFRVLWPAAGEQTGGNNQSCVLLVSFSVAGAQVRLLLPGDIDRAVEARLLAQLGGPVDWVLAPHHGSKTSSSPAFVQRTEAHHVIFSAGYKNRYGHPHPQVEQRWRAVGATLYNTALDGAVVFTWRDAGLEVKRTRRDQARVWF